MRTTHIRQEAALAAALAAAALLVGQLSSTAHAAGTSLSGSWSGRYSGAYKGTFSLRWTQAGSKLNGTIKLSSSPGTLGLKGTVRGTSIRFGTVGGPGITYSGSASRGSMSGHYQTPGGGGTWSAHKTSS